MKVYIVSKWHDPFQGEKVKVENTAYTEEDEASEKFSSLLEDEGANEETIERLMQFALKPNRPVVWSNKDRDQHVQLVVVEIHTVYAG